MRQVLALILLISSFQAFADQNESSTSKDINMERVAQEERESFEKMSETQSIKALIKHIEMQFNYSIPITGQEYLRSRHKALFTYSEELQNMKPSKQLLTDLYMAIVLTRYLIYKAKHSSSKSLITYNLLFQLNEASLYLSRTTNLRRGLEVVKELIYNTANQLEIFNTSEKEMIYLSVPKFHHSFNGLNCIKLFK